MSRRLPAAILGTLLFFLATASHAGPPFVTDDPEPLEKHHWEFYLATQHFHTAEGWSGIAPLVEVNYGLLEDLQLHVLAPAAYDKPGTGHSHFGFGDIETGAKVRFLHETDSLPQVGIYPMVELASGSRREGLGNGRTQLFLPVWIQKGFGEWTTYGGGGYWFNPGPGNRNYWYAGWELQRKLCESFTLGAEIQYRTAETVDGRRSVALNAGGIWDLSDTYHILFSAGHTVEGASEFQAYLALQITFGPEDEKAAPKTTGK